MAGALLGLAMAAAGCVHGARYSAAREQFGPDDPVPFEERDGALVLPSTPHRSTLTIHAYEGGEVLVQGAWVYVPIVEEVWNRVDRTSHFEHGMRLFRRTWTAERGLELEQVSPRVGRVVALPAHPSTGLARVLASPNGDEHSVPPPHGRANRTEAILDREGRWLGWIVRDGQAARYSKDPTGTTSSDAAWPSIAVLDRGVERFLVASHADGTCAMVPVEHAAGDWRPYERDADRCASAREDLVAQAHGGAAATAAAAAAARAQAEAQAAATAQRVADARTKDAARAAELARVLTPAEVARLRALRAEVDKADAQRAIYERDIASPPAGGRNPWGDIQTAVYSAEGTYGQSFPVAVRLYVMGKRSYDEWRALEERLAKAKAEGKPVPEI